MPASAQDLIRQLLCRQEERLGRGGLDDFRNHPFFEGVDWERLATSTAPYIPELRGPVDTSNFDVDDDTLNHPGRVGPAAGGKLPAPCWLWETPRGFQSGRWAEDDAFTPQRLMGIVVHLGQFTSSEVGCDR